MKCHKKAVLYTIPQGGSQSALGVGRRSPSPLVTACPPRGPLSSLTRLLHGRVLCITTHLTYGERIPTLPNVPSMLLPLLASLTRYVGKSQLPPAETRVASVKCAVIKAREAKQMLATVGWPWE